MFNKILAQYHIAKCKRNLSEQRAYTAAVHFYKALLYNERLPQSERVLSNEDTRQFVDIRKTLDLLLARKGF